MSNTMFYLPLRYNCLMKKIAAIIFFAILGFSAFAQSQMTNTIVAQNTGIWQDPCDLVLRTGTYNEHEKCYKGNMLEYIMSDNIELWIKKDVYLCKYVLKDTVFGQNLKEIIDSSSIKSEYLLMYFEDSITGSDPLISYFCDVNFSYNLSISTIDLGFYEEFMSKCLGYVNFCDKKCFIIGDKEIINKYFNEVGKEKYVYNDMTEELPIEGGETYMFFLIEGSNIYLKCKFSEE